MGIELYAGRKIDPNNTLLIFDEVQEVPRALSSLKYFIIMSMKSSRFVHSSFIDRGLLLMYYICIITNIGNNIA